MKEVIKLSQLKYDTYDIIFSQEIAEEDRPEYVSKVRKLLFFLLREGFNATVRKIKSKAVSRKLALKKYLVIIKIGFEGKYFYNLSTQYQLDSQFFIIANIFYPFDPGRVQEITSNWQGHKNCFNQFNIPSISFEINETVTLPESSSNEFINIQDEDGIVIIGLGDYSRVYIAPHLKSYSRAICIDYNVLLADFYKRRFKFLESGLTPSEGFAVLQKIRRPLLIIASYHSDHAWIANQAFAANKETFIFIEKPPCVTLKDLKQLIELYKKKALIEIGFNRRHIPSNKRIKELLRTEQGAKVIHISVKEIRLKENHWYFWENQGTRITGNVVHWIDIAQFWIDSIPQSVNMVKSSLDSETMAIAVQYEDGSLLNITVSDAGNDLRGVQEKIEIRCGATSIFIDDYLSIKSITKDGKFTQHSKLRRNKGHESMYNHLLKIYKNHTGQGTYPLKDLINTTIITYSLSQMYRQSITSLDLKENIDEYMQMANMQS